MFPGQGSQFVGMGKDLVDQFPAVKPVFEQASDAIKVDVKKLCFDGPESDLTLTANTQPCILTVSIAVWRVLKNETGFNPYLFAGHSLGEYSAAVASEKVDFERAVYLVRRRGEAMQEAVPAGVGAMSAVMNFDAAKLIAVCEKASSTEMSVEVVNFNSPQQLVIAGHKPAVLAVNQQLEKDGVRVVELPVSAPFHSRLMTKAREAMTPLLEDTQFSENDHDIIANLTGEVAKDYGPAYLIKQIDSPVKWTQTLETALGSGCDTFIEIGPGRVLFGLARRSLPREAKLLNTSDLVKAIKDINEL